MIFLGIDPGLANMGLAVVRREKQDSIWTQEVKYLEQILYLGVFSTEKDAEKVTSVSEANVVRSRKLYTYLSTLISSQREAVQVICAESMSFPPNAASAAKIAMCWGVLSAVAERCRLPILQITPKALKKEVGGRKDLSKKEVELALRKRFPDQNLEPLLTGITRSKYEHCFDALGTIVASFNHEYLLLLEQSH
jgi:Holliday junction resolvasome RuvABC endonuclease subunit